MEDLAKCGAVSLYEYVCALLRRATEAQVREAELALLSLRDKIIARARSVGGAWQAWSDYWNEASVWYRKLSPTLDKVGQ
jgi:hypothetical protein